MSILTNNGKVFTLGGSVLSYIPSPVPTKGDLINMDLDGNGNKTYRVLVINGNMAKVLGMSNISTSQAWSTLDTLFTTTIGGQPVSKYQGSDLDTYLNTTWYNTLSADAKTAIVPQTVVQDSWTASANFTPVECKGTETVGQRNAYALSIQDIVDYLGVDASYITRAAIWKMFWNIESAPASTEISLWLCSGHSGYEDQAWVASPNSIAYQSATSKKGVRPTFTIDLSKISFTKTTEVIS